MNRSPHFQYCTNTTLHAAGLRADAGCFINDLDSGGAHHTDSAYRSDALLQAWKPDYIKASADKLELGYTELPFLGFLMKGGTLYTDLAKVATIQTLMPPTTHS